MQIQCTLAQEHGDLEAKPVKLAQLSRSMIDSRAQDKVGWLRDCQIPPLATTIKKLASVGLLPFNIHKFPEIDHPQH
jgi:hypothetical protein